MLGSQHYPSRLFSRHPCDQNDLDDEKHSKLPIKLHGSIAQYQKHSIVPVKSPNAPFRPPIVNTIMTSSDKQYFLNSSFQRDRYLLQNFYKPDTTNAGVDSPGQPFHFPANLQSSSKATSVPDKHVLPVSSPSMLFRQSRCLLPDTKLPLLVISEKIVGE